MTNPMRSNDARTRLSMVVALAMFELISSLPAAAATGAPTPRFEERASIRIGPIARAGTASASAAIELRLPVPAIVHGVSAELRDAAGEPVAGDAVNWRVRVSIDDGISAATTLGILHAGSPVTSLPKPLGYRVGEGEAIVVYAELREDAAGEFSVELVVAYEPAEFVTSRLAVRPLHLETVESRATDAAGSGSTASWQLEAASDCRTMVLAGSALRSARAVSIEDALTGDVVWQAVMAGSSPGPSFVQPAEHVRVGVALQRGRSYRLIASYQDGQREASGEHELYLLVLQPRGS